MFVGLASTDRSCPVLTSVRGTHVARRIRSDQCYRRSVDPSVSSGRTTPPGLCGSLGREPEDGGLWGDVEQLPAAGDGWFPVRIELAADASQNWRGLLPASECLAWSRCPKVIAYRTQSLGFARSVYAIYNQSKLCYRESSGEIVAGTDDGPRASP